MPRTFILLLTLMGLLFGCDDAEESAEPVSTEPIVGSMEIPISLRNDASALGNAANIEVSARELRIDHRKILDLESGRLPEGAAPGHVITVLQSALAEGGDRPVSMRVHFATPFETFATLINTVEASGREEMSIEVRRGQGVEAGFLRARFRAAEASDEPVEFDRADQLPWDAIRQEWENMDRACEQSHSTDCDGVPSNIAEGGSAAITLWARGRAVRVQARQFGAPDPEPVATGGPEMIEGVPQPGGNVEEPPPPPPATEATFTWEFQGAVQSPSPISDTVGAVCGSRRCGIVLTAEAGTMYGRLISLLGAAFPNGRPAPTVHVVIPERR